MTCENLTHEKLLPCSQSLFLAFEYSTISSLVHTSSDLQDSTSKTSPLVVLHNTPLRLLPLY